MRRLVLEPVMLRTTLRLRHMCPLVIEIARGRSMPATWRVRRSGGAVSSRLMPVLQVVEREKNEQEANLHCHMCDSLSWLSDVDPVHRSSRCQHERCHALRRCWCARKELHPQHLHDSRGNTNHDSADKGAPLFEPHSTLCAGCTSQQFRCQTESAG